MWPFGGRTAADATPERRILAARTPRRPSSKLQPPPAAVHQNRALWWVLEPFWHFNSNFSTEAIAYLISSVICLIFNNILLLQNLPTRSWHRLPRTNRHPALLHREGTSPSTRSKVLRPQACPQYTPKLPPLARIATAPPLPRCTCCNPSSTLRAPALTPYRDTTPHPLSRVKIRTWFSRTYHKICSCKTHINSIHQFELTFLLKWVTTFNQIYRR